MVEKTNFSLALRGEGVRRTGEGLFVFLKRIRHCAGFGVQSPTDYAFVREVIYERWPYALYAELEAHYADTDKFLLKLSQLLLRVSNYAQASQIGIIGPLPPVMEAHLKAGCRKSEIVMVKGQKSKDKGQEAETLDIFPFLIATELNDQWREYISQEHIISYDLYYLGIAFYDEKRYREEHVINFY